MKPCNKCNIIQPLSRFKKDKRIPSGFSGICKACHSISTRVWQKRSKKWDLYRKQYDIDNSEKELARKSLYKRLRPEKRREWEAKRRAAYKRATPKWLTPRQHDEIKAYKVLAAELQWLSEERLVVDHIIPLLGRNVSGLHVPWNLQILPASLNCSKSNKCEG